MKTPCDGDPVFEAKKSSAAVLGDARVLIVREMLQRDPTAPASALKTCLEDRGHPVSLRTAQRLRAATTVGKAHCESSRLPESASQR
jgi:hypothetical protein